MRIKHMLVNNQARQKAQSAHTKRNKSMEKRIESFWQEFEKRGSSFNQFVITVLEALIILDHRNRFRPAGAAPKRILNGKQDGGFNNTMICEMAERTLSAKAGLAVPPAGVSWRLQRALEAIGEEGEENSGAAPGLWGEPAKRLRVLVVEDEAPIARDIANILQNAGFEAVGPAAGSARALELVKTVGCDAAVLDIRLGSRTSEPVALALRERGTPFIAVSAYSRKELPASFGDSTLLDKPLKAELLIAHLRRCVEGRAASPPNLCA